MDIIQLNKLPKWAQEEIKRLNREIASLTVQRDEAQGTFNGKKTSNVWIDGHSFEPDIYLPNDSHVTFKLETEDGRDHEVTMHFVYEPRPERKYRVAVRTGWGQMKITPNCANVIEISEEK